MVSVYEYCACSLPINTLRFSPTNPLWIIIGRHYEETSSQPYLCYAIAILARSDKALTRVLRDMDITGLLGSARTSFTYSKNPINLYTKAGSRSMLELCQAVTPPCRLNPLLFNGHLQTFWTVVKSQDVPIYYKRKVFEADNPNYAGSFAVDFVVEPYEHVESDMLPRTTHYSEDEFRDIGSLDSKPMLVTLHGLSGGSHELYLRHVLAPLVSKEGGWAACVVNARGCAMSKITSGVLYNARATWDVRQVVKWLRETFPNRELYGIGFSLGANILTNVCTRDKCDREIRAKPLILPLYVVPW